MDIIDRLEAARGDNGGSAIYSDQDAIDDAIDEITQLRDDIDSLIAANSELARQVEAGASVMIACNDVRAAMDLLCIRKIGSRALGASLMGSTQIDLYEGAYGNMYAHERSQGGECLSLVRGVCISKLSNNV